MNNAASNAGPSGTCACGSGFTQKLVSQEPVYDRKLKVHRPRKKRGRGANPRFL